MKLFELKKLEVADGRKNQVIQEVLKPEDFAEMFEQQRLEFRVFHDNSAYSRSRVIAPNVATARGWSGTVLRDEKSTNWKDFLPPAPRTPHRRPVGNVGNVGLLHRPAPPCLRDSRSFAVKNPSVMPDAVIYDESRAPGGGGRRRCRWRGKW